MLTKDETVLSTSKLTKTYGKKASAFTALKDIDIDIKHSESVAIIGKSGSGKSTLMHLLALLDKPTKGSVYISGQNARSLSKKELDRFRNQTFGFVFQQFFLNGNNTVLENVILPLKIAGLGRKDRKLKGLYALKTVELLDKAKSKANDLSGGQKQRVCIARALINDPAIIFADEPTGNLDSETGKNIENILFKLNKEHGITLLVVTHDDDLASKCDRQIYIKDGQIVKETRREG